MKRISILNGRVIDPANHMDRQLDLHIDGSHILALGAPPQGFYADQTIDAAGRIVCPGLIDLRARLREPGMEYKANIASETRAAAASGVTTLCIPPDTDPIIDTPAVIELIHKRANDAGMARVEVLGAMTQQLKGIRLAEMGALKEAGCVGISNANNPIENSEMMRHAMEYAATFDLTVFLRAEEPQLAKDRHVHEGGVSTRMGLPGIPETAETIIVARDLLLAEQTGARIHFCHLSTARAVEMVREARGRGLPVSADVSAHQLHLTEMDIADFNAQCHVRPPLRTQRDKDGLRQGLAVGVIPAITSDHQPHDHDAKLDPFAITQPGISALETMLPLTLRLVDEGVLGLSQALAMLTSNPAQIMGLEVGALTPDKPADICIFNPEFEWTFNTENMVSRGHNSPFHGWRFRGKPTHTFLAGRLVFETTDNH